MLPLKENAELNSAYKIVFVGVVVFLTAITLMFFELFGRLSLVVGILGWCVVIFGLHRVQRARQKLAGQ